MKITLDASEIEVALSMYIASKYPALAGKPCRITLSQLPFTTEEEKALARDGHLDRAGGIVATVETVAGQA